MMLAEDEVFQINFFGKISINTFYNHIIPQIRSYFHQYIKRKLVFNFADLEFIYPNVVPNILNIADIYRKYTYGEKITLGLSWNPVLFSYLDTLHFFKYADDLNLFNYNSDMVGGFDPYPEKKNFKMIYSSKNSSEDEITNTIENLMSPMEKFKRLDNYSNRSSDYENIIFEIFFQLIQNANDELRGNSNAYALFEINPYRIGYLSVCDSGKGIKETINKQLSDKKELKPLIVDGGRDSTAYYILEALFWRIWIDSKPPRPGLFHVTKMVLENGGKIGIHSHDTRVQLTGDFLDLFCRITEEIKTIKKKNKENNTEEGLCLSPELLNDVIAYAGRGNNTSTRRYEGVHIDIEIPLGGKNDIHQKR